MHLCCLCASCKLRNKSPRSHRAAPSHSVPCCEWNRLHFSKILSAYFLSQQLHIQVSQTFHCLIYFLFSPVVNNCQVDARMVLVACTHWWAVAGERLFLLGLNHACGCILMEGRLEGSAAQKWNIEVSPNTEQALSILWGFFLCCTESKQCAAQSVETSSWIGAKDIFYFCFFFLFSLSWMPWV